MRGALKYYYKSAATFEHRVCFAQAVTGANVKHFP